MIVVDSYVLRPLFLTSRGVVDKGHYSGFLDPQISQFPKFSVKPQRS